MKLHRDHITLDIIRLKHVIILNLIHILAVTGQDLPQEIEILKPAVMMNLLGRDLDLLEDKFGDHPEWHVHIYGKTERKPDRKMGHMTILTNNVNETENEMLKQFKGRE